MTTPTARPDLPYPTVSATLPPGRLGGSVNLTVTGEDTMLATTGAGHRITHHTHDYEVTVFLRRDPDGTWRTTGIPSITHTRLPHAHSTRLRAYPAPLHVKTQITAALTELAARHWAPALAHQAATVDATNLLHTLDRREHLLRAELDDLDQQRARARAVLDRPAPPVTT